MDLKEFEKEVDYWVNQAEKELHCFNPDGGIEQIKSIMLNLYKHNMVRWYFLPEKKGLMVYSITPDFRGNLSVNEVFMYILPAHRGNIRLFKELVQHLESVAAKEGCHAVRIASNIGYNDELVLKCLKRFGYQTDVVVKYLKG